MIGNMFYCSKFIFGGIVLKDDQSFRSTWWNPRLQTRSTSYDFQSRPHWTRRMPEPSPPSQTQEGIVPCRHRCRSYHGGCQETHVSNRKGVVAHLEDEFMG